MLVSRLLDKVEFTRWGLRGDPYLFAWLKDNVDKTLDLPTWKETKKYITKLLNEKTGHDLMNEGGLGFVMEEFKHGGMSSGGISFKFWQMRFFPQLLKEFEK